MILEISTDEPNESTDSPSIVTTANPVFETQKVTRQARYTRRWQSHDERIRRLERFSIYLYRRVSQLSRFIENRNYGNRDSALVRFLKRIVPEYRRIANRYVSQYCSERRSPRFCRFLRRAQLHLRILRRYIN